MLQTFFLSNVRDSLILSTRSSLFPSNFSPSFHCLIQLYLLMSFSGNWIIKKQRDKEVLEPRNPSQDPAETTKPTRPTFVSRIHSCAFAWVWDGRPKPGTVNSESTPPPTPGGCWRRHQGTIYLAQLQPQPEHSTALCEGTLRQGPRGVFTNHPGSYWVQRQPPRLPKAQLRKALQASKMVQDTVKA